MAVVGIVMGSDSDWPVMEPAALALEEFDVPYEAHVVSAHRTPRRMLEYAETAVDRGLRVIIAGAGGAAHLPGMVAAATPLPVIGVPRPLDRLDGLDSLLSIVQMPAGVPVATVSIGGGRNAGLLAVRILAAADSDTGRTLRAAVVRFQAALALDEFGVAYEAHVVSAHRTPRRMLDYAESAADRGLRVIIAGAGGAAHLPGMVAAATPLPVIGVPRALDRLDGMDSLLSIVQMPAGVPVATVGIDGGRNAGLLAVRILAASDDVLRAAVTRFQTALVEQVAARDLTLQERLATGR